MKIFEVSKNVQNRWQMIPNDVSGAENTISVCFGAVSAGSAVSGGFKNWVSGSGEVENQGWCTGKMWKKLKYLHETIGNDQNHGFFGGLLCSDIGISKIKFSKKPKKKSAYYSSIGSRHKISLGLDFQH